TSSGAPSLQGRRPPSTWPLGEGGRTRTDIDPAHPGLCVTVATHHPIPSAWSSALLLSLSSRHRLPASRSLRDTDHTRIFDPSAVTVSHTEIHTEGTPSMRRTVTAIAVGTLAAGLFSNTAPDRRLMSLRTCRRRPPKRSTTPCSPRHARATPSPSLLLKPSTPAALAQGCTRKHDGLGPVREDRPIRPGGVRYCFGRRPSEGHSGTRFPW